MAKKNPVQEYLAEIGRKGGKARVPKGFATPSPAERSAAARKAVQARWAKVKKAAKKGKAK